MTETLFLKILFGLICTAVYYLYRDIRSTLNRSRPPQREHEKPSYLRVNSRTGATYVDKREFAQDPEIRRQIHEMAMRHDRRWSTCDSRNPFPSTAATQEYLRWRFKEGDDD